MKRRDPDALPPHLAGRPDFEDPDYPEWWALRKAWARERGENVALVIIEERTLKARHRSERAA